jgi:hypothetical protein
MGGGASKDGSSEPKRRNTLNEGKLRKDSMKLEAQNESHRFSMISANQNLSRS